MQKLCKCIVIEGNVVRFSNVGEIGVLPGDSLRVIYCYQLLSGPRTRPVTAGSGLGAERNENTLKSLFHFTCLSN